MPLGGDAGETDMHDRQLGTDRGELRRDRHAPPDANKAWWLPAPTGRSGSDWPHLPDGQRDTGEILNLLADWAPDERDRRRILVESPKALFFVD
ncbi:MAG: 2-pyrone-4,6-dicarboxylate lactonase [Micromonosporaceae bacterium]|jgi:hypothetical protein|nr:2-pyrone-4,6-dicarboxylate lactonase [Micromonosporaceae bacterium]